MKWVSYTRSISSRIGEENPSNTIAEQNERIARYLKKCGCSVSEKYSDRKRTAEATEGFDKLVQDGMARKFDAVVVDSIFRCGRTLPFAIEALQRTFYPLGIQFAVVEDDFCSADKTAEEVAEYFNGKTIDKIRSEFITNRQNHFEEGTLTHRQAKYGYALSEDRRSLVLNPESAQVVKLIKLSTSKSSVDTSRALAISTSASRLGRLIADSITLICFRVMLSCSPRASCVIPACFRAFEMRLPKAL